MLIAIHSRKGSFSDRWIQYCIDNNLDFKIVNCYSTDIIDQLKGCSGLMWHWSHGDYKDQNFARQLIMSVEKMGISVFPNFDTCWHFDDKIGQKYLLESLELPLVPSYVFYNKKEAIAWLSKAEYPLVFKLRGGAGSYNVKFVKNFSSALHLVHKMFNKGIPLIDKKSFITERWINYKRKKDFGSFILFIKGCVKFICPINNIKLLQRQKGYVYFQKFIANNTFDDRIIIIGDKAIKIRRFNRQNDFRASGSGMFSTEPHNIDLNTIELAFKINEKLDMQACAVDIIYHYDKPLIAEVSYGFAIGSPYDDCPGYWQKDLTWVEDVINPQNMIIEQFINKLRK